MRAEKVIKALLQANAGVAALVGSGNAARIFGGMAKQEAQAPLIVYSKQSAERVAQLNPDEPQLVEARIDVLCVAKTYAGLKELGEAVRLALKMQSGTVAGVTLVDLQIEAEGSDEFNVQLEEFGQTWTFLVVHEE